MHFPPYLMNATRHIPDYFGNLTFLGPTLGNGDHLQIKLALEALDTVSMVSVSKYNIGTGFEW